MLTFSFLKPKFSRKNVENNISRAIQRAKSENLSCPSCTQFCLTHSLILKTVLFLKLNILCSPMFCLLSCRTSDCEPVHVLRTFVHHFMRGRALDIQDPTQPLEGKTAEIFISRLNLYEDGLDELLGSISHDPSLPLEVTFCGELAQDSGGPRKEFLGAVFRAIKDNLFVAAEDRQYVLRKDVVPENRREYFFAGLMFGKNVVLSNVSRYNTGEIKLKIELT